MGKVLLVLALVLAAPASVVAHKGHRASPSPSPAAASAPARPDGAPAPVPVDEEPLSTSDPAESPGGSPAAAESDPEGGLLGVVPWSDAFFGHAHNKLVHFPLAFGLAAAVILLVTPRWPSYEPAGRALLVLGALVAVAAYFTGQQQEEPFKGSPLERVLELHEWMGIVTGVSLWIAVAASFVERARAVRPLIGLWLLVVLSVTGFLGGVLSHS